MNLFQGHGTAGAKSATVRQSPGRPLVCCRATKSLLHSLWLWHACNILLQPVLKKLFFSFLPFFFFFATSGQQETSYVSKFIKFIKLIAVKKFLIVFARLDQTLLFLVDNSRMIWKSHRFYLIQSFLFLLFL